MPKLRKRSLLLGKVVGYQLVFLVEGLPVFSVHSRPFHSHPLYSLSNLLSPPPIYLLFTIYPKLLFSQPIPSQSFLYATPIFYIYFEEISNSEKTQCNIYPDFRVIFTCTESYLHVCKIYSNKLEVMVTKSTHCIFFSFKVKSQLYPTWMLPAEKITSLFFRWNSPLFSQL